MTLIRILQLTDLHVFAEPHAELKGIPTRETFQKVVEFIVRNEAPFDHVVVTGDHTHDELRPSYEAVRQILAPWYDRLWQVPGNHDDRSLLRRVFRDRIRGEGTQPITFRFVAGGWLCVGLDTHVPGEVAGDLPDSQLEWLSGVLSEHPDKPVALFLHHPPVEVGSIWMDRIGLSNREKLQQLVIRNHRIRLIVCGHVHHEFHFTIGPATVLSTPSTGIQFDPAGQEPNFAADAPGYRLIELDGPDFRTQVVRLPELAGTPVAD